MMLAFTAALHTHGLRSDAKATLLAMADGADPENRCAPSMDSIRAWTGLSPEEVYVALNYLKERGVIEAIDEPHELKGMFKTERIGWFQLRLGNEL